MKNIIGIVCLCACALFAGTAWAEEEEELKLVVSFEDAPEEPEERDGSDKHPYKYIEEAIARVEKDELPATVWVDSESTYTITNALEIPAYSMTFMQRYDKTPKVTVDAQGKCRCVNDPKHKATFEDFIFQNGKAEDGDGGGVVGAKLVRSIVRDCETVNGNGGGVFDSELENCQVVSCSACSEDKNDYERGNGGAASQCRLYNCLVVSNRTDQAGGATCRSILKSCTIVGNLAEGKAEHWAKKYFGYVCHGGKCGDEDVYIVNSIMVDNRLGEGHEENALEETHDMAQIRVFNAGDPKFVDEAHGDYRLRPVSPCIDIGNTGVEGETEKDFAGNPRVRGAGIDVGCYEFQCHAAFPPGSLSVSSNAQVIGTVLYAQGDWRVEVAPAAKGWLSADVTSGSTTNSLRLTFAENTTGKDREGTVSVYTNRTGGAAVQTCTVRQVASATLTELKHRKGLYVGCAYFGPKPTGEPWQGDIAGSDNDALFYRDIWSGTDVVRAGEVVVLTNAEATLAAFTNNADAIIANLTDEDEFLLALSTHGGADSGQWKPGFTLYPNKEEVSFSLLSNVLFRAADKCSKVICVMDACHSAAAYKFADQISIDGETTDRRVLPSLRTSSVPSPAAPYDSRRDKIALIAAADYDQTSESDAKSRYDVNGLFTACIINGLDANRLDADGDGYVDWHEAWRYSYYHSKTEKESVASYDGGIGQARCYNADLLLKTRLCEMTSDVGKPTVDNPLNPYFVDYVNWMSRCDGLDEFDIDNPVAVDAQARANVTLTTGQKVTLPDLFVAGYDPVPELTNVAPFTVSIAVTNATPYLSWMPYRKDDPNRIYTIRAKAALTNDWTVFSADVPPETLKPYHFFSVGAQMRQ